MAKRVITPPMTRFEISDPNGVFDPIDITRGVESWKEMEILIERDGVTGAMPEISFPIMLVNEARELVRDMFNADGMYAQATFDIYRRDDWILDKYTLVKSMPLDFRSYKEYNNRVEIDATKSELAELVNSSGKTKFDIKVSDIAETKKWRYDRINVLNGGSWVIPEDIDVQASGPLGQHYMYLSVQLSNAFQAPGSAEHDIKSQPSGGTPRSDGTPDYPENWYFFMAASNTNIRISLKGNFRTYQPGLTTKYPGTLVLFKNNGQVIREWSIRNQVPGAGEGVYEVEVDFDETISLQSGDRLRLAERVVSSASTSQGWCHRFDNFELEYVTHSTITQDIDVIKPNILLQKFIDLVTNKPGHFTSEIVWDEGPYDFMLSAGESIRNIPDAYLHGSLRDFIEWMRVLGYDFDIVDRKMTWRFREYYFNPQVTAMELRPHELADLVIQADADYAYTRVTAGYEREDYDNINGRLACNNGVFEYTTDFKNREENELKLVSPYKSDIIGIELLTWTANQSTRDTKSDNDIYCLAMKKGSAEYYALYDDIVVQTEVPSIALPNAPLNPYYFIQRNQSLIGINSKGLRFAGTDIDKAQTAVFSNQINPYRDWSIGIKLFSPITYNFAAGSFQNIPDPSVQNGLIKFVYQGIEYSGFIKKYRKNEGFETETTWELWAHFPREKPENKLTIRIVRAGQVEYYSYIQAEHPVASTIVVTAGIVSIDGKPIEYVIPKGEIMSDAKLFINPTGILSVSPSEDLHYRYTY